MNITSINDFHKTNISVKKVIEVVPLWVPSNGNTCIFIQPNHDIPLGGKLYY